MSDYTFDQRCLQTLALVAWVQQQVEADELSPIWCGILTRSFLKSIYRAAVAGDDCEYLRLLKGYPLEFIMSKMRVFVDNTPADWQVTGGSRPSNQSHYWHELSSK